MSFYQDFDERGLAQAEKAIADSLNHLQAARTAYDAAVQIGFRPKDKWADLGFDDLGATLREPLADIADERDRREDKAHRAHEDREARIRRESQV